MKSRGSETRQRPRAGPTRTRLDPATRERQIVHGAIAYFAEVGNEGDTRELARRLAITQPLLFRYFPTKGALIERIYEEVFLNRWKAEWETLIADPSTPAIERFRAFEIDYQRTIDDAAWLRIFVSAGMKGLDLPNRYIGLLRQRIFSPLLVALRAEHGLPSIEEQPLAPLEFELLFGIHGALVYSGLRRHVYGVQGSPEGDAVRASMLDAALVGLRRAHIRLVTGGPNEPAEPPPNPRRRRSVRTSERTG